jgi:hypothetical protein
MNAWVRLAFSSVLLAALAISRPARAEKTAPSVDGVYGRFDGDLDLSLAAGSTISREGLAGALFARALFLETAGAYVSYADRFTNSGDGPRRSLGAGVALRPLFVPRWGLDLEHGPPTLDLLIDSTTLELGALWVADGSPGFSRPPCLELALGMEVPLWARIEGLWLGFRGALRWSDSELSGSAERAPLQPSLAFTLGWHVVTGAHLVDTGDRRMR